MPDMDTYWHQRAKQQSAQEKKVDLSTIPTWDTIYGTKADDAFKQHQAEVAAGPYAFTGQGMAVAPGSKFAPSKDELVNGKKETNP